MSRLFAKLSGFFSSRTLVGIDKAGNRCFTRKEEVDGIMKEKRWVIFKEDQDPTSIPVEWICWLNGQRKKAPTPEELLKLEAKRERVKQNVACNVISKNNFLLLKREVLKKEEEEKRIADAGLHQSKTIGKDSSPDLKSFINQFPGTSFGQNRGSEDASDAMGDDKSKESSSEPTGSGTSFKPGTWQPPN